MCHSPRLRMEFAAMALALIGSGLAIAGAVAPWATQPSLISTVGNMNMAATVEIALLRSCTTTLSNGVRTAVQCVANSSPAGTAAAACLFLGFIFGFFDFLAVVCKMCCGFPCCKLNCANGFRFMLVILAFAFTFMGTVIGGGAQMGLNVSSEAGQKLAYSTMAEIIASGSGTWLGGLGCSIASVVVQFLAVVLASVALCCVRTVEAPAKAPQEIAATAV